MKRTWDLEEKVSILKEAETNGVVETCRKHGIYATTYYEWKKKYSEGGESALLPGYAKRERKDIKKLEKENERLKKPNANMYNLLSPCLQNHSKK